MSSPANLTDISAQLARRLKARRVELNLSQREAAELIGVSERTLQNWEAETALPWPKHRRAVEDFLTEQDAA